MGGGWVGEAKGVGNASAPRWQQSAACELANTLGEAGAGTGRAHVRLISTLTSAFRSEHKMQTMAVEPENLSTSPVASRDTSSSINWQDSVGHNHSKDVARDRQDEAH